MNFKYLVLVIILGSTLTGCSTYIKQKCVDGEFKVPRNVNKAYAKYVKGLSFGLGASANVYEVIKIDTLNLTVKENITQLYNELNNYSSRTESLLMTSFNTLSVGVCDPKIRDGHTRLLDQISVQNAEIAKLENKLKQELRTGNLDGSTIEKVDGLVSQLRFIITE